MTTAADKNRFGRNRIDSARRGKKIDLYETPYNLTRLLLDEVRLPGAGAILEPAAGKGAIVKVLREYGYKVKHYDAETDFLLETRHFGTVVTNPPFSLALEFVLRAKEVSDDFFFLLPLMYLHGKGRYEAVYSDRRFRLKQVFVFTRYPQLGEPLRKDGRCHTGGPMAFAWYWFSKGCRGRTTLKWLDNGPYILGRRDD